LAAATAGGLLTAAVLQAAAATADTVGDTAELSGNAFTVGGLTFDPGSDGYEPVNPFVGIAPLLKIGFSSLLSSDGSAAGTQDLVVYDGSGAELGMAHASVNASDLLGIDSAQFTVQTVTPPVADIQAALTGSGLDFAGAGISVSDLANALAATPAFGSQIPYGTGDISSDDVLIALLGTNIDLNGAGITDADIAAVLNGIDTSALPDAGTVFSITNFGSGWANVYAAVPNADGTGVASITDTLVTPFGNLDIPTTFDAVAAMDPGAAFADLDATTHNADIGDDAFTLGGITFDPGGEGFAPVFPLFAVAPLMEIGGGQVVGGGTSLHLATQDFTVYDNSGSGIGSVTTAVNVQNLLGIESTQLTVIDGAPADGAGSAALPTDGTVYSVTDFGSGFANVYIATPNADGTAAATITDKVVTPWGNFELPTGYDAIALMDPGAALAGLGVAAEASGLSDNAFTIGGVTFDPGSAGFDPINETSGIAPLLQIGGGTLGGATHFANQALEAYGDSGDLGSVVTAVETASLLGLVDTTTLTVDGYDLPAGDLVAALENSDIDFTSLGFTAADLVTVLENYGNTFNSFVLGTGQLTDMDLIGPLFWGGLYGSVIDPQAVADVINGAVAAYASDLPELGTVYSVIDFGGGFENVYWALPNEDGDAAASIHDMLVTPFGNLDLSSMFDAVAALDPGDAAAGISDAGAAFDIFDPGTWF